MPYYRMDSSPSQGSEWFALYGFRNHTGNCYVMAATFYYMAKALGYDAHQVAGYVPKIGAVLRLIHGRNCYKWHGICI